MPCSFVKKADGSVVYEHDPLCEARHSALKYREPWRWDEGKRLMRAWKSLTQTPNLERTVAGNVVYQRLAGSLLGPRLEPLPKPLDVMAGNLAPAEDETRSGQGTMPKRVAQAKLKRALGALRPKRRFAKRRNEPVTIIKVVADGKLLIVGKRGAEEWDIPGLKMPAGRQETPRCSCGVAKGAMAICRSCGHRCLC